MRKAPLSVCMFFLAIAVCVQASSSATLPPFELPTLDNGRSTDLDVQGQVLLFFTLPDCDACLEGLRLAQAALVQYPGVTAAAVIPEATDTAHKMVADESITWPVIVDETFLLASIFGIGRVPTVCLLQDGQLVGRLDRGFTAEDISDALAEPFGNLEAEEDEDPPARDVTVAFTKLQEPLLLMFAGAECGYCHHMLPSVFEIAEYMETTIVITEELVDPETFESDAERLTILVDPYWELASAFGIPNVPTVFFIDTDGTIVWSHTGIVEGLPIVAETFLRRATAE